MNLWQLEPAFRPCCCQVMCWTCYTRDRGGPCQICRAPLPKSREEHLALLKRHAKNGVPEAINAVGDLLRDGPLGSSRAQPYTGPFFYNSNCRVAATFFERAVELGSVQAMTSLGLLHENGLCGKRDMKKATRLYRMASDRGNARAQEILARHLQFNTTQSLREESFRLYKLSAEQGYTQAAYELASCYERGRGVERDLEEAKRLYTGLKDDLDYADAAEHALHIIQSGEIREQQKLCAQQAACSAIAQPRGRAPAESGAAFTRLDPERSPGSAGPRRRQARAPSTNPPPP